MTSPSRTQRCKTRQPRPPARSATRPVAAGHAAATAASREPAPAARWAPSSAASTADPSAGPTGHASQIAALVKTEQPMLPARRGSTASPATARRRSRPASRLRRNAHPVLAPVRDREAVHTPLYAQGADPVCGAPSTTAVCLTCGQPGTDGQTCENGRRATSLRPLAGPEEDSAQPSPHG